MKKENIPAYFQARNWVVVAVEHGTNKQYMIDPMKQIRVKTSDPGYSLTFDQAYELVSKGHKLEVDGKYMMIRQMAVDVGNDAFCILVPTVDGKIPEYEHQFLAGINSYIESSNGCVRMYCKGHLPSLKLKKIQFVSGEGSFVPMCGNIAGKEPREVLDREYEVRAFYDKEFAKVDEEIAARKRAAEEACAAADKAKSEEYSDVVTQEDLERQVEEERMARLEAEEQVSKISEPDFPEKKKATSETASTLETEPVQVSTLEETAVQASLIPEVEGKLVIEASKETEQTSLLPEDSSESSLMPKETPKKTRAKKTDVSSTKTTATKSASKTSTPAINAKAKAAAEKKEKAEAEKKMKEEMARLAAKAKLDRFNYLESGRKENLFTRENKKIVIGAFPNGENLIRKPGLTAVIIDECPAFHLAHSWAMSPVNAVMIDYEGISDEIISMLASTANASSETDIRYYEGDPAQPIENFLAEIPCEVVYIHASCVIAEIEKKNLIDLRRFAKRNGKHIIMDVPESEKYPDVLFDHIMVETASGLSDRKLHV